MDPFADLLTELGALVGTPLTIDAAGTCLLVFDPSGVKLQLERDKAGDHLLIGSMLGELPPGPYRIQVLSAALKKNISPETGILAFSLKKNSLVLFQMLPFTGAAASAVWALLQKMQEKAQLWQEAISRGELPS